MASFVGFPQDGHAFSASEVGLALAGLIERDRWGAPREGMLGSGPTGAAAGASWKIEVGAFVYVRNNDGAVQLSGLSSAEQADIVPASGDVPAGQSRIDIVCWDTAAAELVTVKGTPAVSPVAPSTTGKAPIYSVRVNAGDGMVLNSQIAPVYAKSAVAGLGLETYTPAVSGYSTGFAPAMRAQYAVSGDVVEVELQAVTDREFVRLVGPIFVTVPVPFVGSPISMEGGGFFLAGPDGAKRIYDLRVRQASATQVTIEMLGSGGRVAERIAPNQAGFASTDWLSWRARFSYSLGS